MRKTWKNDLFSFCYVYRLKSTTYTPVAILLLFYTYVHTTIRRCVQALGKCFEFSSLWNAFSFRVFAPFHVAVQLAHNIYIYCYSAPVRIGCHKAFSIWKTTGKKSHPKTVHSIRIVLVLDARRLYLFQNMRCLFRRCVLFFHCIKTLQAQFGWLLNQFIRMQTLSSRMARQMCALHCLFK